MHKFRWSLWKQRPELRFYEGKSPSYQEAIYVFKFLLEM